MHGTLGSAALWGSQATFLTPHIVVARLPHCPGRIARFHPISFPPPLIPRFVSPGHPRPNLLPIN